MDSLLEVRIKYPDHARIMERVHKHYLYKSSVVKRHHSNYFLALCKYNADKENRKSIVTGVTTPDALALCAAIAAAMDCYTQLFPKQIEAWRSEVRVARPRVAPLRTKPICFRCGKSVGVMVCPDCKNSITVCTHCGVPEDTEHLPCSMEILNAG